MKDELFRQEVRSALDAAFSPHEPTEAQKENMYRQITGGIPMKRKTKISLGLVLALVLALLAVGAMAAALLSAQEVIEKNAVPMARENDTDARSDCHAWGSILLYELPAVILGVRPAKPGYAAVSVKPNLGYLDWAEGSVITPKGMINVSCRMENGEMKADISVPEGLEIV